MRLGIGRENDKKRHVRRWEEAGKMLGRGRYEVR
jgi:hypothetical protein